MKILIVTEYYPPHMGGVEVVFSHLAQGLVKRGHECCVVTSRLPGTKECEQLNGVRVYRVRVPRRAARYWFAFLAIPKVLKLAKGVDVIHTTTFSAAFPAWVASKLLRRKCIITVHEVWGSLWHSLATMNQFSARLHRFLERIIVTLPFDKHICVSRYTLERLSLLAGIGDEKLAVIHNGIDQELFDPAKADGHTIREKLELTDNFVLLYYGRPGISKGLDYLIKAAPLVLAGIREAHFLLVLGREPRREYESTLETINNVKIEDSVTLMNSVPRNELPNYIAASDCVVVPSLSEGFGFTAAEACAMGKPVVASNVASLPEVVSGKYVLVEPRSSEAIAKGVEKVYKGKLENGERRIFDWDKCVEEYLRAYQEVIACKSFL